MNIRQLNEEKRSEARSLGLCDQWYDGWSDDASVSDLLGKYVRGIDFVIKHHFPSDDDLVEYASRRELHEHGIYVNESVDGLRNETKPLIFNGNCSGEIIFDDFSVGNIYLRGKSDIEIYVRGLAKVFVEIYDDARVTVVNNGDSRCFVYLHGGKAEVIGDVVIRDKR